jgi:hypothetical protein
MRNFPGPRWIIVQQVQQWWSCFDQSPSGQLLVVEPDYLPHSEVFFSVVFIPHEDFTPLHAGVCKGGLPPPAGFEGLIPLAGGSMGKRSRRGKIVL